MTKVNKVVNESTNNSIQSNNNSQKDISTTLVSNPNILTYDSLSIGKIVDQLIREIFKEIFDNMDLWNKLTRFDKSSWGIYDIFSSTDFTIKSPLSLYGRYKLFWLMKWTYTDATTVNGILASWLYTYLPQQYSLDTSLFHDSDQKPSHLYSIEEYYIKLYNNEIIPHINDITHILIDPQIFVGWCNMRNLYSFTEKLKKHLLTLNFSPKEMIMEVDGQLIKTIQQPLYKFTNKWILQTWMDLIEDELFYDSSLLQKLNKSVSDDELLKHFDKDGQITQKYKKSDNTEAKDVLNDYLKEKFIKYISEENKLKDDETIIQSKTHVEHYLKNFDSQYQNEHLKKFVVEE